MCRITCVWYWACTGTFWYRPCVVAPATTFVDVPGHMACVLPPVNARSHAIDITIKSTLVCTLSSSAHLVCLLLLHMPQASATSSSSDAAAAAVSPIKRRTPSPPPPIVDDSPAHTVEYVGAVLDTRLGPPIHLPEVLLEEPLGLDRYM